MPSPLVVGLLLALGLVCGAVAYLLYFRLVTDIGAAGALTVTYLIPVFGVLWGALFLGESISLPMLGGAALVLLGTLLRSAKIGRVACTRICSSRSTWASPRCPTAS